MGIRETLVQIVGGPETAEERAQLIMGFLSCRCGLDNGNGWYDNDPQMAQGGLDQAEEAWMARNGGRP